MRPTSTATATLTLSSLAFGDRGLMPRKFSCDGTEVSPPLSWSGAPDGTRSFALTVEDPDAGGFVHWVVAGIPGDSERLDEGASGSDGLVEGRNSFGKTGWEGRARRPGSIGMSSRCMRCPRRHLSRRASTRRRCATR